MENNPIGIINQRDDELLQKLLLKELLEKINILSKEIANEGGIFTPNMYRTISLAVISACFRTGDPDTESKLTFEKAIKEFKELHLPHLFNYVAIFEQVENIHFNLIREYYNRYPLRYSFFPSIIISLDICSGMINSGNIKLMKKEIEFEDTKVQAISKVKGAEELLDILEFANFDAKRELKKNTLIITTAFNALYDSLEALSLILLAYHLDDSTCDCVQRLINVSKKFNVKLRKHHPEKN